MSIGITQPIVSHHMKVLCVCGLVTSRKDGTWMHYTIDHEAVKSIEGLCVGFLHP